LEHDLEGIMMEGHPWDLTKNLKVLWKGQVQAPRSRKRF